MQAGDSLVTLRAGGELAAVLGAQPEPLGSWQPSAYVMKSQDEQPLGATSGSPPPAAEALSARAHSGAVVAAAHSAEQRTFGNGSSQGLYVLPLQASRPAACLGAVGSVECTSRRLLPAAVLPRASLRAFSSAAQYTSPLAEGGLLIAGWKGRTFMFVSRRSLALHVACTLLEVKKGASPRCQNCLLIFLCSSAGAAGGTGPLGPGAAAWAQGYPVQRPPVDSGG